MTAPGQFICNICGTACVRTQAGREVADCPSCKSTGRLRGLAALISRELLGVPISLPDLPAVKSLRGVGMSDPPSLASRLAEKFDYTNTFYHQAPQLDITAPVDGEIGRYDFIVSSEVMEHVPVPVEKSFANLYRMLKPDGLLLLTVPYRLDGETQEHFPELFEYSVATVGGRTVLVNRRRDGSIEVFENLCFHGGDGSTLEMRVFSESSLTAVLKQAGFKEVEIASGSVPEFGVDHAEAWSLPLVARKGRFERPSAEVACAYRDACRRADDLERNLATLQGDYQRYIEFHERSQADADQRLATNTEWVRKVEADFAERTEWAQQLEKEKNEALAEFRRLQASELEAWQRVAALERELGEARAARTALESRLWTRTGRKLGFT